ncbi:hypothetical protein EVAR_71000_1 [Eumeta japonica]|uniref:Uncharacterized protein n=1 Tax=Eumeta variegata TaxID=151549 RepID=A0A4C2A9B3_EUMVA|nr:hypothetical protein EVAR_71000_1 [Eumeta japonica]
MPMTTGESRNCIPSYVVHVVSGVGHNVAVAVDTQLGGRRRLAALRVETELTLPMGRHASSQPRGQTVRFGISTLYSKTYTKAGKVLRSGFEKSLCETRNSEHERVIHFVITAIVFPPKTYC